MKAVMIKDDFSDLALGYQYEIDKVYCDGHIRLKGMPGKYTGSSFEITHKGKVITVEKAYMQYFMQSEDMAMVIFMAAFLLPAILFVLFVTVAAILMECGVDVTGWLMNT